MYVDEYGIASGIQNLDIQGARYNVDLTCHPYVGPGDCAFEGRVPFFGTESAAIAAVDAINGALTAAGADMVNNHYGANGGGYFVVDYSDTEAIVGCGVFYCDPIPGSPWYRKVETGTPDSRALVHFSLAPVPLPAAIWLFGGALVALGGVRRSAFHRNFWSATPLTSCVHGRG